MVGKGLRRLILVICWVVFDEPLVWKSMNRTDIHSINRINRPVWKSMPSVEVDIHSELLETG